MRIKWRNGYDDLSSMTNTRLFRFSLSHLIFFTTFYRHILYHFLLSHNLYNFLCGNNTYQSIQILHFKISMYLKISTSRVHFPCAKSSFTTLITASYAAQSSKGVMKETKKVSQVAGLNFGGLPTIGASVLEALCSNHVVRGTRTTTEKWWKHMPPSS